MEVLLVLVTLILLAFLALPAIAIVRTTTHGPRRARTARRAA